MQVHKHNITKNIHSRTDNWT